jgi:hypothetical protein
LFDFSWVYGEPQANQMQPDRVEKTKKVSGRTLRACQEISESDGAGILFVRGGAGKGAHTTGMGTLSATRPAGKWTRRMVRLFLSLALAECAQNGLSGFGKNSAKTDGSKQAMPEHRQKGDAC